MDVKLLQFTPNPIKVVYVAARTCYAADTIQDNWDKDVSENKMLSLLDKVFESGHHSVFEHINFTFAISGISRVCSHQLVRHRLASFSQQSQRYVVLGNDSYVIPPSIDKNSEMKEKYIEFMDKTYDFYNELMEYVKPEDARFVLPNSTKTNIVMSMNFR